MVDKKNQCSRWKSLDFSAFNHHFLDFINVVSWYWAVRLLLIFTALLSKMAALSRKPVNTRAFFMLIVISFIQKSLCKVKDSFSEELYIKSLERGNVLHHFQFTTLWNASISDENTCKGASHCYLLFIQSWNMSYKTELYYVLGEFSTKWEAWMMSQN